MHQISIDQTKTKLYYLALNSPDTFVIQIRQRRTCLNEESKRFENLATKELFGFLLWFLRQAHNNLLLNALITK